MIVHMTGKLEKKWGLGFFLELIKHSVHSTSEEVWHFVFIFVVFFFFKFCISLV